jgi:hypothetical protein
MNEFGPAFRPSRKTLVLSLLGLSAFLAVEAVLMRHFTRVDTRPPSWDQSVHLEIALDYRQALSAGRWSDMWFLAPKPGMPPFPPAYHLLLRGAYGSPDPARSALWYNWFYLAVLAVSLFGIAWGFLPDGRALAATLLFCAAPGIQELYTTQLVDLAVVAWTAAAYWALLACDGFSSWGPSLGFGALFAVGMLHKWSFFSYMIPAYLIAGRALSERHSRPKVLAAAALSLALFAPWYASHLALLPSRLFQASSDFGVPFWKGDAWLVYLRDAAGPLGPVLWALGFLGILSPQYVRKREYAWIVAYWVAFSYVFWTIVPNRQIRFLLPGLAPLGMALAATWPESVAWGAAVFQLALMVNFFFGWLPAFDLPISFVSLPMFASRPPAAENWRIDEILRRIDAERDPARPLTNVTLVANDVYFNGPTFHWEQRRLGLKGVSMRGVNKRLCELSEFVLLKDGGLGPEGVIGGLPEAAKTIRDPDSWFQDAFAEDARWPLPDKTTAILYRLRQGTPAPWVKRELAFREVSNGDDHVESLRLVFHDWQPQRSSWRETDVSAARVRVRGLTLTGIRARLEGFGFMVPGGSRGVTAFDPEDARLTRLDRVTVESLQTTAADLKAFLVQRVPGLELDDLTLDGTVRASGRYKGKAVALAAALDLDSVARVLRVRILSASYMGTPLPLALFKPIKELTVSLDPNPETPFAIDLPGLTIKNGRLTIP